MQKKVLKEDQILKFDIKRGRDLLKRTKKTEIFSLHITALENSKLRVLKENQILKFDIKEDKDKLQAINLKKN